MKKYFFTFLSAFLLNACIHAPQGLEMTQFNAQSLNAAQNAQTGERARLGGKILNATALPNQTKLEILSLPIFPKSAKPNLEGASDGRFIAYLNGFVDPETLNDQFITVGGTIVGRERGKIDQANYDYVQVKVEQFRLWKIGSTLEFDDDFDDFWRNFGLIRPLYRQNAAQVSYYLY